MPGTKDEKEKTEDNEDVPQIKTRQKQFLEERLSIIKPKTEVEIPTSVMPESTESSLKENFHQDLIDQYRKCQKHKIEDE